MNIYALLSSAHHLKLVDVPVKSDGHLAPLHERLVVVPGALAVLLRPHSLGYAARAAKDRCSALLLDASM